MEWTESYSPNYFSIEDILATQQRIPCKFELPLYGLGYLDPSNASNDLEVGSKLELPFWMAQALSTSSRRIVTTELPLVFKAKYREILTADPNVVNLHKLGPYFYELGQHILVLAKPGNEGQQISSLLCQTLRERLRFIMDAAQNSLQDDCSNNMRMLDELERTLFTVGQNSLRDHEKWIHRKSHILTKSSFIEKCQKRKFSEIT